MTDVLEQDEVLARIEERRQAMLSSPQGGEATSSSPPDPEPSPADWWDEAENLEGGVPSDVAEHNASHEAPGAPPFRYIHPFADAADGLIETVQNTEGRFRFNIDKIDYMTRGLGRGELMYVTGKSHSAKTQLVLQGVINNGRDARIILFTPDEVAELVLAKLVSMSREIDSEELEQRIKDGDEETIDLVRRVASHDFENLLVVDESIPIGEMKLALVEAEKHWGAPADCVILDYLECVKDTTEHGMASIDAKSNAVKVWSKEARIPLIVLRQSSRGSAPRGRAGGIEAMSYGGEADAIMILEVYRKVQDETLDAYEREYHEKTVTVNLCKNKRPPSKKGEVELRIHSRFGKIQQEPFEDDPFHGGFEEEEEIEPQFDPVQGTF